jgi:squalene synthase HpnC
MARRIPAQREQDFAYCERVTRDHYENFSVVTRLVPAALRPHICAIYAFCRGVDDLGDEYAGDRLAALDAWEEQLAQAYDGEPSHPVFRALRESIRNFGLCREDFLALIEANRMDQLPSRYRTFADLREYCRHSADPVGRLVLSLFGCRDEVRTALSDDTCTALQIANFLQDLDRDVMNGRFYIPEEDLERFGCSRADLERRSISEPLRACIRHEVDRTARLFASGARLETLVPFRLGLQLRLYRLGGEAILAALRKQRYDPFLRRPTVEAGRKAWIALQACAAAARARG